jgi:hypothetical protein
MLKADLRLAILLDSFLEPHCEAWTDDDEGRRRARRWREWYVKERQREDD